MIDQEKRSLSSVIILVCVLLFLFILLQWITVNNLLFIPSALSNIILKDALSKRVFYVIVVPLSAYLFPKRIRNKEDYPRWIFLFTTVVLAGLLINGFKLEFSFYNLYFFPVVFILYTILVIHTIPLFRENTIDSEKTIFGVSNESSDFYFEHPSTEGNFRIHKPEQNIYIEGGPGSGKSDTFIKGMIYQCAERNYGGMIYDWEGDPTKDGSPILGRVAYGSINYFRKFGCRLNFAFLNFTDMSRTVRVNVISERNVPPNNPSLFIKNQATNLMKNLEPAWKEKTDFWANNAINLVYSVAYKCYKERHLGINTLPHAIAFCLSDSSLLLKWLSKDPEIALNISSILSAWRMGADQQTAGVLSSAQTPLSLLNNKYIFWVLSPPPEEEFNLDITNPDNPTLLCIGNAPSIKEAISAPISCIASVIMAQMNNPGKIKGSVFMLDEFPTLILQGIDMFSSTARKHFVSTIFAVQDFNQAVRDYGEKSAKIIKGNSGTQMYGMTGNNQTAKDVEGLFGEIRERQESFSTQDSGTHSTTESLQKEKILKARDIAGQGIGHFVGKTANGKPPFFNLQFNKATFVEEDIPQFSLPANTGDPVMNMKILENIVQKNYISILDQVNNILKEEA